LAFSVLGLFTILFGPKLLAWKANILTHSLCFMQKIAAGEIHVCSRKRIFYSRFASLSTFAA
jgi:hypothetical protein